MSESLIFAQFLFFLWAMWVNRSFCSNQMSNVSKLLISLTKKERPWANEWIAHLFEQIAHSLILGQKTSDSLGNQMSECPALNRVHYRAANFWTSVTGTWYWKFRFTLKVLFIVQNRIRNMRGLLDPDPHGGCKSGGLKAEGMWKERILFWI